MAPPLAGGAGFKGQPRPPERVVRVTASSALTSARGRSSSFRPARILSRAVRIAPRADGRTAAPIHAAPCPHRDFPDKETVMIRTGDVIHNSITGETIRFVETAADTDGERVVIDVLVEPNGFVAS